MVIAGELKSGSEAIGLSTETRIALFSGDCPI
jgi:hypothetical protein